MIALAKFFFERTWGGFIRKYVLGFIFAFSGVCQPNEITKKLKGDHQKLEGDNRSHGVIVARVWISTPEFGGYPCRTEISRPVTYGDRSTDLTIKGRTLYQTELGGQL
jgi:hypothetical protein